MDVTSLTEVLGDLSPSTTSLLDVSMTNESGAHERDLRWRVLRQSLVTDGAPEADLAAIDAVVAAPLDDGSGGDLQRYLVVRDGKVLLDQLLHQSSRDGTDVGSTGLLPDVAALLRYDARHANVVVVRADEEGADVEVLSAASAPAAESETVHGDTTYLHKTRKGPQGGSGFAESSENVWKGNAEEAAGVVDRMVREHSAAAVVVAGQPKARTLLVGALSLPEGVEVSQLDKDARADGSSQVALEKTVLAGLDELAARTEDEAVGRWRAVHDDAATATRSTDTVAATVSALAQGQVEELLLDAASLRSRTLLVGPAGTDIASPGGTQTWDGEASEVPADLALLRAAAHTGADVVLVELEGGALPDGVGARLRWATDAAPGDGPTS